MPYIMHVRILYCIGALIIAIAATGFLVAREPWVFLIGDSTMAEKPLIGSPERGWGQFIPMFFQAGPVFENHARNGRSTKSFIAEGRWVVVRERLKQGDYVMIQFGHNDAKKEDRTRYAEARTEYRSNLLRFIREAREKGATPILLTPVCRRRFDAAGKFYDVHGDYPLVVRELAVQEQVAMVDLNRRSYTLFESLGVKESEKLFLRADSGMFSAFPHGKKDDTHFSASGATEVARLVAEELRQEGIPLSGYLKKDLEVKFEGTGHLAIVEGLLQQGVNRLCSLLVARGADVDTIAKKPLALSLRYATVYIMTGDGPRLESDDSRRHEVVHSIAEWVRAGGKLILIGSPKAASSRVRALADYLGVSANGERRLVGRGAVVVMDSVLVNSSSTEMMNSLVDGILRNEITH